MNHGRDVRRRLVRLVAQAAGQQGQQQHDRAEH
jgi:hypothetical protein